MSSLAVEPFLDWEGRVAQIRPAGDGRGIDSRGGAVTVSKPEVGARSEFEVFTVGSCTWNLTLPRTIQESQLQAYAAGQGRFE